MVMKRHRQELLLKGDFIPKVMIALIKLVEIRKGTIAYFRLIIHYKIVSYFINVFLFSQRENVQNNPSISILKIIANKIKRFTYFSTLGTAI